MSGQNKNSKKILAYIVNEKVFKLVNKVIKDTKGLDLLVNLKEDRSFERVLSNSPDLILLQISGSIKKDIDFIEEINAILPTTIIVAIFDESNREHIQNVLLSGARAFIVKPVKRNEFQSTINRVIELQDRLIKSTLQIPTEDEEEEKLHKTIVVFSPRGGVGTTTIASNLAIALQNISQQKTLLFDGKQFFGHLDIFFNVMSPNNLLDLVPHLSELDQVLLDEVIVEHASGIDLMLGPNSLPGAQGLHPDNYYSLVRKLQEIYEYIVIDGGHSVTENTVTLLDVSKVIALVINPDLASLKDARDFIGICNSLSYPTEKLVVLLNNLGLRNSLETAEINKALSREIFGTIPNDPATIINAINYGVPVYFRDKKRKFSRSIEKIGKQMIRYLNRPSARELKKEEKTNLDLLDKSSRFG
jgi:pilus assembly protein CpaE